MKKFFVALGLILLIFGGTTWAWSLFANAVSTDSYTNRQTTARSEALSRDVSLSNQEPISVLFVGADYAEDDLQRSDTLIVATLNPEKETTTLTSVPRDTWVPTTQPSGGREEETVGSFDKINHSYHEGLRNTQTAMENFLGIPIHYAVSIDMEGVEKIIDALGGLELTPDQSFTQYGTSFTQGESERFSGGEVMNYVRMRKQDPKGDMGRQDRQRQVLRALAKQFGFSDALRGSMDLMAISQDHIQTNVDIPALFQLYRHYQPSLHTVESIPFTQYQSLTVDSVSYVHIPDSHRYTIHKTLNRQLGTDHSFHPIVYPTDIISNQRFNQDLLRSVVPGYLTKSDQSLDSPADTSQTYTERTSTYDNDL